MNVLIYGRATHTLKSTVGALVGAWVGAWVGMVGMIGAWVGMVGACVSACVGDVNDRGNEWFDPYGIYMQENRGWLHINTNNRSGGDF